MLSFDAKLVNRALQGDNTAFDRLVQQYQVGLLNRALSEVHNRSDAEDLVQEAFLHAYQYVETLKAPDKFAGRLYSITCSLCHDTLRKRRLQLERFRTNMGGGMPDNSTIPDFLVAGHETADSLVKAIAGLPGNTRQVFVLYLQGWSYRSISGVLGLSFSTVSGRLQRAKRQVKENLLNTSDCVIGSSRLEVDWPYLRQKLDDMSTSVLDSATSAKHVTLN